MMRPSAISADRLLRDFATVGIEKPDKIIAAGCVVDDQIDARRLFERADVPPFTANIRTLRIVARQSTTDTSLDGVSAALRLILGDVCRAFAPACSLASASRRLTRLAHSRASASVLDHEILCPSVVQPDSRSSSCCCAPPAVRTRGGLSGWSFRSVRLSARLESFPTSSVEAFPSTIRAPQLLFGFSELHAFLRATPQLHPHLIAFFWPRARFLFGDFRRRAPRLRDAGACSSRSPMFSARSVAVATP